MNSFVQPCVRRGVEFLHTSNAQNVFNLKANNESENALPAAIAGTGVHVHSVSPLNETIHAVRPHLAVKYSGLDQFHSI